MITHTVAAPAPTPLSCGGRWTGMAMDASAPTFATLLRRSRQAAGLTQEELAERARLSVRGITDLERGVRRAPHKETVHLLAEALGLDPGDRAAFEAAARRPSTQQPRRAHEQADDVDAPPPLPRDGAGEEAAGAADAPTPAVYGGFLGALPTGPLVGREPELRRILAAVDAVAAGQGRLLLLAGEPGVGKTRLAQELMVRSQGRGCRALTGRCEEQYASLPFFPFIEALTGAWRIASSSLRQLAATRFAELGRLLPRLLPAPPPSEVDDPRLRMLHTAASFLQALAAEGPLAVLIDDLHWADSASLELLAYLTRALRGAPVLLVGTYRDVEVGRQHPLEGVLTTLTRDRVVDVLTLRGLPPAGTAELIRAHFGVEEVSEELRDLVHERTEGNPFFTEEVLSALVEQGAIFRSGEGWGRTSTAEIAVPQSIRSVVGQRVGRLAAGAQDLLRLASVLGQEWDLPVLLEAADQEEQQVLDHLDAALAARLLEERRTRQDERYGFAHALIGQALYQEVPRHRLRRLHLRAGEALERVAGERPEAWAELARHFLAAGERTRATRYAVLAGDHAAKLYAHAEAVQHYEAALDLLEEAGDERETARVQEHLGLALRRTARYAEALAAQEQVARAMRTTGDLEGLGRVTAETGWLLAATGAVQEGFRRLNEVLPLLEGRGPSAALAAVYTALGDCHRMQGRYDEQLLMGERLADLARALGDDRLWLLTVRHRAEPLQFLGRATEALRVCDEAIALAQRAGDRWSLGPAMSVKGYVHLFRGEWGGADDGIGQSIASGEGLGDLSAVATEILFSRHMLLLARGDWALARRPIEQGFAGGAQFSEYSYERLARGTLCLVEGDWDEAERQLEAAAEKARYAYDLQALRHTARALAELAILRGRPGDAVARLAPLRDRPGLEEFDVTYFLPVLAWAYLELDDVLQAEQVIAQALRRARAEELRLMLVDALRVRALLCIRQRHWTAAASALEEGLAVARSMPHPYAEARLLQVIGQLQVEQGAPERAREPLQVALGTFQQLGARKDVERSERLLAALR